MGLGEILGAALSERAAPDESLLWFSLIDLTASHYGLHPDEVAETLWEIKLEMAAKGQSIFSPLARPLGFATLALMVGQRLLGSDEVAAAALLNLSIH